MVYILVRSFLTVRIIPADVNIRREGWCLSRRRKRYEQPYVGNTPRPRRMPERLEACSSQAANSLERRMVTVLLICRMCNCNRWSRAYKGRTDHVRPTPAPGKMPG